MKKSISYVLAAAALVAFGAFAPVVHGADEEASDPRIDKIIETQEKILATLEEIQAELKIIKVRATMK